MGPAEPYIYPPPLNFTTLRKRGLSGGILYYQIMNGITGTAMPYFKRELESEKIWAVGDYVAVYFVGESDANTEPRGIDAAYEGTRGGYDPEYPLVSGFNRGNGMFYAGWIALTATGILAGLAVFVWALKNGQLQDQGRARFIPLLDAAGRSHSFEPVEDHQGSLGAYGRRGNRLRGHGLRRDHDDREGIRITCDIFLCRIWNTFFWRFSWERSLCA